jgi:hypothetical protein
MRYLGLTLVVALVVLCGCGALRSLTTQHYAFSYAIPAPPAFSSPVGTPPGEPYVTDTTVTITDELVTKFDKYHGGVDWAGLVYNADLSRGTNVNLKFLVSLTAPVTVGGVVQVPADAVQLEDFTLTSADPTLSVDETQSTPNTALATFLANSLRTASGSLTVYLYFEVTAPSGGGDLALSQISIHGLAHGSLF